MGETLQNLLETSKHSSVWFGVVNVTQRLSCCSQELLICSVFSDLLSGPKIKTIKDTYHKNTCGTQLQIFGRGLKPNLKSEYGEFM